jgi:hypothetical protein
MFGVGYHQAGFLEDLSAYGFFGGFARFQATAGQGPPLAAAGSSASLVHHQDAAVTNDHGGGPFSVIHDAQANPAGTNCGAGCGQLGSALTDLDGW